MKNLLKSTLVSLLLSSTLVVADEQNWSEPVGWYINHHEDCSVPVENAPDTNWYPEFAQSLVLPVARFEDLHEVANSIIHTAMEEVDLHDTDGVYAAQYRRYLEVIEGDDSYAACLNLPLS